MAIALGSQGVHSNGFSLVRKIIETQGLNWEDCPSGLGGQSLGEVLLTPTQIYVKPVLEALHSDLDLSIHAMAHITGGGLPENLPRCLGHNQSIQIQANSWEILPIFRWLAAVGQVNETAMLETFNMGVGFVVLVPPEQSETTISYFQSQAIPAYEIGQVIEGNGRLVFA